MSFNEILHWFLVGLFAGLGWLAARIIGSILKMIGDSLFGAK